MEFAQRFLIHKIVYRAERATSECKLIMCLRLVNKILTIGKTGPVGRERVRVMLE